MNVFFPHNRILLHKHHSPSPRHVWGHYFSSQFAESNFDDISFLLCCACHICGIIDGTCSSRCAGHPLSQSTHFSPTNLFVDTIMSNFFLGSHKIAHFACANFFIAYILVMITPSFKVNVWWSRWRRKLGCTILLRWGATQIVTQIGFDEWASSCDDETTPLSCYSSALQCVELILVFTFSHVKSEIQEKVGVYLW